jgi:hypothetical protein
MIQDRWLYTILTEGPPANRWYVANNIKNQSYRPSSREMG